MQPRFPKKKRKKENKKEENLKINYFFYIKLKDI